MTDRYLWNEHFQRSEYVLVVHLGANVVSTVDAEVTGGDKKSVRRLYAVLHGEEDRPECTSSLNHHILIIVREPGDQRSDDVFALEQSSSRGIILYQIRHGNARPLSLG